MKTDFTSAFADFLEERLGKTVSFDVSFTVNAKALTNAMIQSIAAQTYTGSAITPTITVTDSGTLTLDTDYQNVTYNNNTNAGTASVQITGKGNYSGTATANFTINPKNLSDVTVAATFPTTTYNGSAQTPTPTQVTFDGTVTTSYTLGNYQNNTNAGSTASVDISGTGNYTGTKTVNFTIGTKSLTLTADNKTILVGASEPAYTYTVSGLAGSDTAAVVTAEPTLSVAGFSSAAVTSFTINISGGTVSSNYTIGSYVTGTLTVTAKTPVTISGLTVQDGTYNGQGHKGVTGTASSGAYTGALEYTYTGDGITGSTTTQPSNAGSYTLTVSVPDNDTTYTGSQQYSFTISKATITITAHNKTATVGASQPAYTYTASGLVGSETLATQPTVTCPTANMSAAGAYPIVPSGAAAPVGGNYNAIVYVNGTLTVSALPQEATPNAGIDFTDEKLTGLTASAAYSK